ncbi:MAG: adenylyl-sulfate kinase, partial [Pseudomonadota bacterium]
YENQQNIVWHQGQITKIQRQSLLGETPSTLWLTGLSASGKSTLAYVLEHTLVNAGKPCYVLDGDNIRHGLNSGLGFSQQDRHENIRRISEVAKLMNDAGLIVITAFISPLREDRQMARAIIGEAYFKEVYVSTAIDVCESRDPKGLYAKARAGEVKEFTGISAPYEPPLNPDLVIDTSQLTMADHLDKLMNLALSKAI